MIYLGEAFNGKTSRSHGKKFQVSFQQEMSRVPGNLGWAYMQQQSNYEAAELVYRKAQTIEPDANRACNLGLCLVKQGRHEEARQVLEESRVSYYAESPDRMMTRWLAELNSCSVSSTR